MLPFRASLAASIHSLRKGYPTIATIHQLPNHNIIVHPLETLLLRERLIGAIWHQEQRWNPTIFSHSKRACSYPEMRRRAHTFLELNTTVTGIGVWSSRGYFSAFSYYLR